jgi:thiol-disulfide isomerase/thioredoxin
MNSMPFTRLRLLLWAALLLVCVPAHAATPWLGVGIEKDPSGGVLIADVLPESPLLELHGKGAVGRGDVLIAVDGKAVASPMELLAVMRSLQVGQRIKLTVRVPNDKPREVEVTLRERLPPEVLQMKTLFGKPAPDFFARGVSGPALPASGRAADGVIASLRGTPVLLDFFATWCGPCMQSIPRLSALQQRYPGLRVIGLSDEQPEILRPMVSQLQPVYTVAQDPDRRASRAYRIYSYPTLVLVDRGGVVRAVVHGDLDRLEYEVAALLQQRSQ